MMSINARHAVPLTGYINSGEFTPSTTIGVDTATDVGRNATGFPSTTSAAPDAIAADRFKSVMDRTPVSPEFSGIYQPAPTVDANGNLDTAEADTMVCAAAASAALPVWSTYVMV